MPLLALLVMAVHAALFLLLVVSCFYLLGCGLLGRRGRLLPQAIAACALELGILALNHWVCPLTPLAERLGARNGSVADLFLPLWTLPYVFPAFGALVGLGALLVAVRMATGRLPPRAP